jgi:hypothetical protein
MKLYYTDAAFHDRYQSELKYPPQYGYLQNEVSGNRFASFVSQPSLCRRPNVGRGFVPSCAVSIMAIHNPQFVFFQLTSFSRGHASPLLIPCLQAIGLATVQCPCLYQIASPPPVPATTLL